MRVLVSAASRHGATGEIAREIAAALADGGHEPVVMGPDDVLSLDGFGAVIVGSALYMGEWMDAARAFIERFGPDLATRPVWLFSSGPLGAGGPGEEEPAGLDELLATTRAREHVIFAGRFDPTGVGLGERVLLEAGGAPTGDFRPWDDIRGWATGIATNLRD
jgi:menaquinone-dependent protoporphyrinogen oxidase